jgi:hypothetical protein
MQNLWHDKEKTNVLKENPSPVSPSPFVHAEPWERIPVSMSGIQRLNASAMAWFTFQLVVQNLKRWSKHVNKDTLISVNKFIITSVTNANNVDFVLRVWIHTNQSDESVTTNNFYSCYLTTSFQCRDYTAADGMMMHEFGRKRPWTNQDAILAFTWMGQGKPTYTFNNSRW